VEKIAALVVRVGPEFTLHLVVGYAHTQRHAIGQRGPRGVHARTIGQKCGGQVDAACILVGWIGQVLVGATGDRVLLGHAARQVPALAARRGQQLELVERVHGLALDLGRQLHGVDVQPDVHAHIAEQKACQVLVGLLAVDDAKVARVRAVGEGLGAGRARLALGV